MSFTIASQTIASSPDGSETSSAASSACGAPAATVGGGCRFRASSTVTSSSSPCNNTSGHSRTRARAGRAFLASCCPVCTPVAVYAQSTLISVPLEYPGVCPVVLCARLVAAVHAHQLAQWQVGHGFLGLPTQNGMAKLTKPGERAHRHSLGVYRGSRGKHIDKPREGSGARYGMGVQ